jgi:hypothetical protein
MPTSHSYRQPRTTNHSTFICHSSPCTNVAARPGRVKKSWKKFTFFTSRHRQPLPAVTFCSHGTNHSNMSPCTHFHQPLRLMVKYFHHHHATYVKNVHFFHKSTSPATPCGHILLSRYKLLQHVPVYSFSPTTTPDGKIFSPSSRTDDKIFHFFHKSTSPTTPNGHLPIPCYKLIQHIPPYPFLSPAAHLSARIQKLTSTHNPCFSLFITQVAEDPKFYD